MTKRLHILVVLSLWTNPAAANVVGNDTQNFNPVSGSTDFVTVQSSSTLGQGHYNVGLFVDDAGNTLPYRSESRGHVNDSLVGMSVGAGVGLLPGVELGVALPFVVHQNVADEHTRGEFAAEGNTAVRADLKWAFLRRSNFGLAVIGSVDVDRVQEDPYTGQANATIYNGELAGDVHAGRVTLGLNVGYRTRKAQPQLPGSLVSPVSNEGLASGALSYRLQPKLSLVAEAYGAKTLGKMTNDSDRSTSSAEATAGVRYDFTPTLLGHAGVGRGLMHGLSTPDWRVYAGLVTEFGPGGSAGHTTVDAKKRARRRAPSVVDEQPSTGGSQPAAAPAAAPVDDVERGQPRTNEDAMALVPAEAPSEVFVLHNINFEFDSDYRVLKGAIAELDKLVAYLQSHPYDKLVIEGHCDFMGTDAYNDDLSNRRARTVRRQLIRHYHMDPEKLLAVGFGKRRPMTADPSDYGRQLNRRVEIKIYRSSDVSH